MELCLLETMLKTMKNHFLKQVFKNLKGRTSYNYPCDPSNFDFENNEDEEIIGVVAFTDDFEMPVNSFFLVGLDLNWLDHDLLEMNSNRFFFEQNIICLLVDNRPCISPKTGCRGAKCQMLI